MLFLNGHTVLMSLGFVPTVSKTDVCTKRKKKKSDFRRRFDSHHIWRLFEKRLQLDFSLRCLKSHFQTVTLESHEERLRPTLEERARF